MVLNRIALTGATGMLGRHVQAEMASVGIELLGIPRSAEGGTRAWDLARWMSDEELDRVFAGAQAVVHAGAMVQTTEPVDRGLMFDVNVRSCLNLGEWALKRDMPIVHISSSTVYANPRQDHLREDAELGWSGLGGFYAFSKLMAEDVYLRLGQRGLKYAVVRPSSLYGCGQSGGLIARFLAMADAGEEISLMEPVEDSFDFIHASDLARAIIAILRRQAWDIYNIGSGSPVSLLELARSCVLIAGSHKPVVRTGNPAARTPGTQFWLDTSRARSRLDWLPQCDILTGLRLMVEDRLSPVR